MNPLAVAIVVICVGAITVSLVLALLALRRVLKRADVVLGLIEREIRPMAAQLGALTEEIRGLSHQVTLEVERLVVVTRHLDEITTTVGKIVTAIAGISRVGQIVGLAVGLRRGLAVFVSRLKSRAT